MPDEVHSCHEVADFDGKHCSSPAVQAPPVGVEVGLEDVVVDVVEVVFVEEVVGVEVDVVEVVVVVPPPPPWFATIAFNHAASLYPPAATWLSMTGTAPV